jgi:hypothetical protein
MRVFLPGSPLVVLLRVMLNTRSPLRSRFCPCVNHYKATHRWANEPLTQMASPNGYQPESLGSACAPV